jgi:Fe-S-cluster containining protein
MLRSTTTRNSNATEGAELLKFRCGGCGTCCHLWIPVTDEDVKRLMEATGLPVEKIVEFVKPSLFGASPGTVAWIKFGPRRQDRRAMCLQEVGDRCLFLEDNRCVIYEHRPVVCREHPFVLSLDESGRRIESIELSDVCDCSHTLDGKVLRRDLKKIYQWNVEQDDSYFKKVSRWNRRKGSGTEHDFLDYLGLNSRSTSG